MGKWDEYLKKEQDTDDGSLFFHTHSLWEVLCAVEKFYECKIYGVLDIQEVESNLGLYYFDVEYTKQELIDAIEHAYDTVDDCQEYEIYLDRIRDFLEGVVNERT